MNDEFDKKLMNLTMNLNIEKSTKINQTRILRMTESNKCVIRVKEETKEQLLKTIVNPTNYMYKGAIKNLIIQVSLNENQSF
jgi:hypothetical protein